jgi:hypothetical protein
VVGVESELGPLRASGNGPQGQRHGYRVDKSVGETPPRIAGFSQKARGHRWTPRAVDRPVLMSRSDDFIAILNVAYRYAQAADRRDWRGLTGCYTEDAVVNFNGTSSKVGMRSPRAKQGAADQVGRDPALHG